MLIWNMDADAANEISRLGISLGEDGRVHTSAHAVGPGVFARGDTAASHKKKEKKGFT